MKHLILMTFLGGALIWSGSSASAAQGPNVLVVTVTKGFRHSSIPLAENVLASLGERTGAFQVDFARTDEDIAQKMTPEGLKKYQAVIFANTTGELPLPNKEAFMEWIRSGRGFAGMHSASDTFHEYRPFIEMIGGEFLTHGPQVEVDVYNMDPEHPACRHWGPHFRIYDEIYILKSFEREKVHGLLTQNKHPNTGQPGDYPIAWCSEYGKGKVFYTSLGHREDVWTNADYQQHILGGIRWVLNQEKGSAKPQSTEVQLSREEEKEGFKPLFNGKNLDGWKLRHADGAKSWSAQNGMLVNSVPKGGHGTDLVSEEKFRDFVIRYHYMVPEGSNSGLYLRGRHEIQILEDYAKGKPEMGGNGALYSIAPAHMFASRKAGQWQEVEAAIQGNRVTVYLNGVKIHDQREVNKPTGGELDAQMDQPGPIMLQGDHGSIAFRDIRIKILK